MPDGKRPISPADRLKEAVWRQIVQLARVDATFRERLKTDPVSVLAAAELDAPNDISFVFIEAEEDDVEAVVARSVGNVIFVPIAISEQNEIPDDALSAVVGGSAPRINTALGIPAMPPNFADSISLSDDGIGNLASSKMPGRH